MNKILTSWSSKNLNLIQRTLQTVFQNGYSGPQLLSQVFNSFNEKLQERIIDDETMTSVQKSLACIEIGKIEKRFIDGADSQLQFLKLFTISLS